MVGRIQIFVCFITLPIFAVDSLGTPTITLYEADGMTPYVPRPLMVGTQLVLEVHSDEAIPWSGGLFIQGMNRGLGILTARGYDPNADDWSESHLPASGPEARVNEYRDSDVWGFDVYTDPNDGIQTGSWFVFDYEALSAGDPNVQLHDYDNGWKDPNVVVSFSHIPSSDLNEDDHVNLADFSELHGHWLLTNCTDPNWCDASDQNTSGAVNINDFLLFSRNWLWPEISDAPVPAFQPDPQMTYLLQDANGLSEISLETGQTVTLYLLKESDPNSAAFHFDVEIQVSDPTLGSLDNREIDPNNPPGPGTARILAQPRLAEFDYWGPGLNQSNAIRLGAVASVGTPFNDGLLARMDYTALAPGSVTLTMLRHGGPVAYMNELVILQEDPNSTESAQAMGIGSEGPSVDTTMELSEVIASGTVDGQVGLILDDLEDRGDVNSEIAQTMSNQQWTQFRDVVESLCAEIETPLLNVETDVPLQ